MHRALLIVNALAGRRKDLQTLAPALLEVLQRGGVRAEVAATTGAGRAQALAAEAVARGCDTVFACGGDGTVHEVMQGLVGTAASLGVVPLGTANVLARHLGLSLDPLKALQQQLSFEPCAISAGEVRYAARDSEATRYFIVMTGAGADGTLVYRLLSGQKSKLGRNAYYAQAARLFLTRRFPAFRVQYRSSDAEEWKERLAVSVMCSRVADLGGVFSRLVRRGSLLDADLRLIVVKPPAAIALPAWFAFSSVGLHRRNPWMETVRASEFRCVPLVPGERVHAEADGEWIGGLPMSVRLRPRAIFLLMPKDRSL